MRRRSKVGLLLVTLGVAGAVLLGLATAATRHEAASVPAFSAKQLGAEAGANWLSPGGNVQNDHYSTLGDINLANVDGLKTAWHVHLGETGRQQMEANGLIYNGTYYVVAGNGDVFAYNASTGSQIWKYNAPNNINSSLVRGIALGDGKIYYGEADDYMVAIDASTGQLAWKSPQIADPKAGYSLNSAATYFNGLVYEGVSGSESGIRGFLQAFNAKTGKLAWRHYFIPGPKDPAFKTWGKNPDWQHGGAGVWTHPVVDPVKGIIYVGTANAAPYHQRPAGKDLYSSSEVAMNAKTGKMIWYYQFVHHDDTDFDVANTATLYDYTYRGKTYHALDQPTKMGFNFILDRYTGKPLIPTPEVPQPQDPSRPDLSKTQPVPFGQPFTSPCATPQEWIKAGGTPTLLGPDGKPLIFGCNFSPILTSNYTVPGWHDDADWPANAFNKARGLFYICSTNNRGDAYEAVPVADFKPVPGSGSYTGNVSLLAGDWAAGKDGTVTAYDPRTNNIVWRATMPDNNGCYSGLTTTAGNLVFVGTFDGHLLAYNAATGVLVWQSPQLDATVAAAPSVYRGSDGKEYVTVLVGGYTISGKAKLGDSVYAFALP
jgi:quinohemoprotein ethanol dehydrogenase